MSNVPAVEQVSEEVFRRIYGDYAEMPGMQLTSKQAARLWGLDEQTCALALTAFVNARFLWRTGQDKYLRTTEGRTTLPPLRMLRASLAPVASTSAKVA